MQKSKLEMRGARVYGYGGTRKAVRKSGWFHGHGWCVCSR